MLFSRAIILCLYIEMCLLAEFDVDFVVVMLCLHSIVYCVTFINFLLHKNYLIYFRKGI